jgi:hypothetical protein
MKSYRSLFLSLSALGLAALVASAAEKAAPISVIFADAEKFTDFKSDNFNSDSDRAYLQTQFTDHLSGLATQLLAPGQKLEVKFTNIDLAGAFEPWRGAQMDNIRIMKDIYPPRASLEFRLLDADGKVIKEGKRELSNLAYQSQTILPSSDGLRYDKQMLSDWMRSEFRQK